MPLFAIFFGLAFGLAAAGNLPPAPAPATSAVVVSVLLALYLSYRAGQTRPRVTAGPHPSNLTVNVATPVALDDRAAERSDARPSKVTTDDLGRPDHPLGEVLIPLAPVDDLEAAALLEDEYGQPVPPQLAGEVMRHWLTESDREASRSLDNGARSAMLSGSPNKERSYGRSDHHYRSEGVADRE